MLMFDYICNMCKHEFEALVRSENKDLVLCKECGGETKRLPPRVKEDWFKPFVSEDFDGTPIEVKSKDHYRSLCRKHNLYAPHAFGRGFNISEI